MAKPKPADSPAEVEIPSDPEEAPAMAEPETPTPSQAALPEPLPPPRPARFLPLVFGGALAAALGFGAAFYLADSYPQLLGMAGSAGIDQQLADHDKRLSDLAAAVADRPDTTIDLTAIDAAKAEIAASRGALDSAVASIGTLQTRIVDLEKRLKALEAAPAAAGSATAAQAAAATEAATAAARKAEEAAARVKAEAEGAARLASARAALGAIQAAYESGAAFEGELAALSEAGAAVPGSLASQAQGIPTLAALRDAFPNAARDALAVSLGETAEGSGWSRLTAFLRSQTGARSLTPRAGDDPDAILSRAEAALATGDLTATLAEIAALPEGGRARLAEWTGLAERRLAAAEALAALAAQLE